MAKVILDRPMAAELYFEITSTEYDFQTVTGQLNNKGRGIVSLNPSREPYVVIFYKVNPQTASWGDKYDNRVPVLSFKFLVPEAVPIVMAQMTRVTRDYSKNTEEGRKFYDDLTREAKFQNTFNDIEEEFNKVKNTFNTIGLNTSIDSLKTQSKSLSIVIEQLKDVVNQDITARDSLVTDIASFITKLNQVTEQLQDVAVSASTVLQERNLGFLNLNGDYLWFDDNGNLRSKRGKPTDVNNDGTVIK